MKRIKTNYVFAMVFVIIVSLSFLSACSNSEVDEDEVVKTYASGDKVDTIDTSDEQSVSSTRTPDQYESETLDNTTVFHVSTIFEDIKLLPGMTAGLWQFDEESENEIHDIFGWSILLGYTYFAFGEDGDLYRVVFSVCTNDTEDRDGYAMVDTRVAVEVDGEWHQAWFFVGGLSLKIVAPYTFYCRETNELVYALLVVGSGIVADEAQLITFRNNTLEVLRVDFTDARPNRYAD